MVEQQPSKLNTWVRFPSPAPVSPGLALSLSRRASYIGPVRFERYPMSRKAMQRLSFFLLMGLTLYAAILGAG